MKRMIDADEEQPIAPVQVATPKENRFFIEELPSQYKLYPEGTKLYGRPLTVREVKKLSSMNEHNFNIILKEVLSGAISGYPIDDILSGDKLYLIFWLRANTYKNARFLTPYVCDHCRKQDEYKFDVGSFDINFLEDVNELELKLLNKNAAIVFKFNTIKDEDRVEKFMSSGNLSVAKYDDEIVSMAAMIKTINGKDAKLKDACDYIMTLDAEDYAYLRSYVLTIDFGINTTIETKCKHCGGENSVQITFRPEFFTPSYTFR